MKINRDTGRSITNLGRLGECVIDYLAMHQLPKGSLFDPWEGKPTPDRYYANAFFALGMIRLLVFKRRHDLIPCIHGVLRYLLQIPHPTKGHREFNQFAFLKALRELENPPAETREACLAIRRSLVRLIEPRFDAGACTAHGNNWIALQALDYVLLGELRQGPRFTATGFRLLQEGPLIWQDRDGIFADHPRIPLKSEDRVTPAAYQAATCWFLAEVLRKIQHPDLIRCLGRGLTALAGLIDSQGRIIPFGRSSSSLFGAACAAAAFTKGVLIPEFRELSEFDTNLWQRKARHVAFHLFCLRDLDGGLRLNPGSIPFQKMAWDFYMYHTVYNAFAAAVFLDPEISGITPLEHPFEDSADPRWRLTCHRNSGLVVASKPDRYVLLSLEGQRALPEFELDPRSSGMNLYTFLDRTADRIPPPPSPPALGSALLNPGFLPTLETKGRSFHPYTWSGIHVQTLDADGFAIHGRARWHTTNPWRNLQFYVGRFLALPCMRRIPAEAWIRRLRSGPRLYRFHERRTPTLPVLNRTIWVCFEPFRIVIRDRIVNRSESHVAWRPASLRVFQPTRIIRADSKWTLSGETYEIHCRAEGLRWEKVLTLPTAFGTSRLFVSAPVTLPRGGPLTAVTEIRAPHAHGPDRAGDKDTAQLL